MDDVSLNKKDYSNLVKLFEHGQLGPLHAGLTQDEVEVLLGTPEWTNRQWEKYGNISIGYGNLHIHFSENTLYGYAVEFKFPHKAFPSSQVAGWYDTVREWSYDTFIKLIQAEHFPCKEWPPTALQESTTDNLGKIMLVGQASILVTVDTVKQKLEKLRFSTRDLPNFAFEDCQC